MKIICNISLKVHIDMNVILCLTLLFASSYCQQFPLEKSEDDKSNIERPCEVFDVNCIRKYFAENSKCKIVHGPVPDPLYFDQNSVFLPKINVSLTFNDIYRRGLNGRIEEFYINKETDKLVLAVEFRNLILASNHTYYIYHRRGKEPIINKDNFKLQIRSLTVTMIIPNIKDLQLQFGQAYGYFNSPEVTFDIGPNAFKGSDPGLQKASIEFLADTDTIIKEGVLTDGAIDIASFIQYNICDFGLQIL